MGAGLLIAYLLPVSSIFDPVQDLLISLTDLSEVSVWGITIVAQQIATLMLLFAIIRFWERRPFSSAGLRRVSLADLSAAAITWFVAAWVEVAIRHLHVPPSLSPSLAAHPAQRSFHLALLQVPEWPRIFIVVGNSFVEEIGRAYAIERLAEVTGSLYAAALLALMFSIGTHAYYGGVDSILGYLPGQLSFVLLYLWRRNTLACVVSHTLANGFGLVVWYHLPISANHLLHRLGSVPFMRNGGIQRPGETGGGSENGRRTGRDCAPAANRRTKSRSAERRRSRSR